MVHRAQKECQGMNTLKNLPLSKTSLSVYVHISNQKIREEEGPERMNSLALQRVSYGFVFPSVTRA